MPALLLGLALLGAVLLIARWYSKAEPAQVAGALKISAVILAVAAAVYLLFVGRAALASLFPILAVALWKAWPSLAARWRAGAEGRRYGQASGVRTPWLAMRLDHASGRAEGEVLQGRFTGRALGSLTLAEALALRGELAGDPQSLALLDAWLDRAHPDWQAAAGAAPASTGRMTREEAYQILGLAPGAGAEEIKAAHRRLMLKLHPDQGGSTWMAAKLNEAKDLLLG
jgi:hypothetical protein